jgi:hypothetical protein
LFGTSLLISGNFFGLLLCYLGYRLFKSAQNDIVLPKNTTQNVDLVTEPKSTSIEIEPVNSIIPNNVTLTKKELSQYSTKMEIDNTYRILDDCFYLVKNTKNFDTFITRFELGSEKANILQQLLDAKKLKNKKKAQPYIDLFIKSSDGLMIKGIQQSYDDMIVKSMNLKTEKGKENRRVKYFNLLEEHRHKFSPMVLEFIETLKTNIHQPVGQNLNIHVEIPTIDISDSTDLSSVD